MPRSRLSCSNSHYSDQSRKASTLYILSAQAGPTGSKTETIAENHLGDEVIGRSRHSNTDAEIDFPLRCEIKINGGKNLVLLLRHRIESCCRPDRAIILEPSGN